MSLTRIPAQIRLGTDPDNNVINVLYTPTSTTLPDGVEIPDDIFDYDDQITTLPDAVEIPDQIFDHDDLITTLPDDVIVEDFVGDGTDAPGNGETGDDETVDITDDMLDNPTDKKDAEETINAYTTGVEKTMTLVDTGEQDDCRRGHASRHRTSRSHRVRGTRLAQSQARDESSR